MSTNQLHTVDVYFVLIGGEVYKPFTDEKRAQVCLDVVNRSGLADELRPASIVVRTVTI